MTHCEIKFENNPLGIYHSGQTLAGCVELRLSKPKRVKGFTLTIKGSAEIEWTEKDSDDKESSYRGCEEFLRSNTALIIRKGGDAIEIPAGLHIYNFSCVLPPQLPTSFEGDYGHIRYTVSAVLERPWKFNQSCKVAFTVLKPLDLNLEPLTVRQPTRLEHAKTFCCWPCRSNPLLITVETPVGGYVPGQRIEICVTLNNHSSVSVHGIVANLNRTVSYISKSPYEKTNSITKSIATSQTVVTEDKLARYTQQLEIPSVVPTGGCSVLTISYELLITVQVGACRVNPRLKIPITIGTIPIISIVPMRPEVNAHYGTFGPESTPSAPPLSVMHNETLPPTYEEAMNATAVNVNDDPNAIGFWPYIPRYPVYKYGVTEKC